MAGGDWIAGISLRVNLRQRNASSKAQQGNPEAKLEQRALFV
jgi:hypothetical protein